jgi:hypothetical protein
MSRSKLNERKLRTAEQRDELAPSHSITSSASARRRSGTVRLSALAVLRLITSSNLVGCSTGSSAACAPLSSLKSKGERNEYSSFFPLSRRFENTKARSWRFCSGFELSNSSAAREANEIRLSSVVRKSPRPFDAARCASQSQSAAPSAHALFCRIRPA